MAVSYAILIRRADLPTRPALQEALAGLGFRLTLDEAYAPLESTGYLPCTLNGEDAGVDLRFEPAEAYLHHHPPLQAPAEGRDILVRLRAGGDPREQVCALMIAAALAQCASAIVHDVEGDSLVPAATLLDQARRRFRALD